MIFINNRGRIVYANEACERIMGYKKDEFYSSDFNFINLIKPEHREQVLESFNNHMKGNDTPAYECTLITRQDKGIDSILATRLMGDGAILGIITDITERKQAEEALQKRNRELDALNRIGRTMVNSMRLNDILQAALDSVLEILELSVGTIGVLETASTGVSFISRGLGREIVKHLGSVSLQRDTGFAGKVLQENRVIVVDNLIEQTDEHSRAIVEKLGFRSAVGIPLKSKNRTLGVIVLTSQEQRVFSNEEIQLLEAVGNQIGIIIENAYYFEKMREQSVTDELTGLYNRRHFYDMLEIEINRSYRTGRPFSIGIIDLDGFKKYNDRLGHVNGDAALMSFARILKSGLRKTDIAARYGGDEFVIILPQTEAGRAGKIIDRIKATWMQSSKALDSDQENPLGFSAGIARFPENAETGDGLVFLADAALFHAKRQGGHRTVLASDLSDSPTDARRAATLDQVYALSAMVDARDPCMRGHSERVAAISEKIGRAMGLSEDELADLRTAALLHDIGKVGIPDSILSKSGNLNKSEWKLVKKHPVESAKIVGHIKDLSATVPAIIHHHERYDGTGYPDGIKGEKIPLAARIMAVADTYDTMTTARPYRVTLSLEEAVKDLRKCAGTQHDPDIVEALCRSISEDIKTEQG